MTTLSTNRPRWLSALLTVSLLIGVSAAHSQADQVPIPKPKPKPDVNSLQKSPTGSRLAVPIPVAKPGMLENLPRGIVSLAVVPNDQYATCVRTSRRAAQNSSGPFMCRRRGAVVLISVPTPPGRVSLPGRPKMFCPFARKFTRWLNEVGAPIIVQRLGSPLAAIQTGSGFVCRNRVGGSLSKISEHARGNALDLMRFDLKEQASHHG